MKNRKKYRGGASQKNTRPILLIIQLIAGIIALGGIGWVTKKVIMGPQAGEDHEKRAPGGGPLVPAAVATPAAVAVPVAVAVPAADEAAAGAQANDDVDDLVVDLTKIKFENGIYTYDNHEGVYTLNYSGALSQGTFGEVHRYATSDNQYAIAVKISKLKIPWDGDDELVIIENLQKKDLELCNTINARVLLDVIPPSSSMTQTKGPQKVVIMNLADGTIDNLYDHLYEYDKKNYISHIKYIEQQLAIICQCLFIQGIGYGDFKSINTFYKWDHRNGRYKTILGDLGGLCGEIVGSKLTTATYPYKTYAKGQGGYPGNIKCDLKKPNDMEKVMVNGISVVLLEGLKLMRSTTPGSSLNNFIYNNLYWDNNVKWETVVKGLTGQLKAINNLPDDYIDHILDMFQGDIKLKTLAEGVDLVFERGGGRKRTRRKKSKYRRS